MLVLFLDTYVVIPLSYVKFCEYASVLYCRNSWRYEGYGIVISDCQPICSLVVLYGSSFAVLLFEKEERGYKVSLVRFCLLNVLLHFHFIDPFLQCHLFYWCHGINFAVKGVG